MRLLICFLYEFVFQNEHKIVRLWNLYSAFVIYLKRIKSSHSFNEYFVYDQTAKFWFVFAIYKTKAPRSDCGPSFCKFSKSLIEYVDHYEQMKHVIVLSKHDSFTVHLSYIS